MLTYEILLLLLLLTAKLLTFLSLNNWTHFYLREFDMIMLTFVDALVCNYTCRKSQQLNTFLFEGILHDYVDFCRRLGMQLYM